MAIEANLNRSMAGMFARVLQRKLGSHANQRTRRHPIGIKPTPGSAVGAPNLLLMVS